MPKFAIDLDGVVVNLSAQVHRLARERHGIEIPHAPDQAPHFYSSEWGLPDGHAKVIHPLYFDAEALATAEPIDGAVEGVARLAEIGEVVLVTARRHSSGFATLAWLQKHGLGGHPLALGIRDKGHWARVNGVDLAIEDAPHNLVSYDLAGIPVIRFAYPYNEGSPGLPAENWAEVMEIVSGMWALTFIDGGSE